MTTRDTNEKREGEKWRRVRTAGLLFLAFLTFFVFFSCKKAPQSAVVPGAPCNLRMEEDFLRWDEAENATGYIVEIDGEEVETAENCLDTFLYTTEAHTYSFRVRAKNDSAAGGLSEWSEVFRYKQVIYSSFKFFPVEKGAGYGVYRNSKIPLSGKVVIPSCNPEDGKPVLLIGLEGFAGCEEITSLIVPATVNAVDHKAFLGCVNLKRVYFAERTEQLEFGSYVFANCLSLKDIRLPEDVYFPGLFIFDNCRSLEKFTIPPKTKILWAGLFYNCVSLKEIAVPAAVEEIVPNAFAGCDGLTSITVDPENEYYRSENNCVIRREDDTLVVGIPTSVIPPSVKAIGSQAFVNRTLREIVIPGTVKTVLGSAFVCHGLEKITIEEGVRELGTKGKKIDGAFLGCIFKELKIPASVEWLTGALVAGCNQLEKLTVDPGNAVYYSENNCILSRSEPELLVAGCMGSVIPSYVKTIGYGAFLSRWITEITIPEGVEHIGERAFYETRLTRVVLPSTLKTIGDGAFYKDSFDLGERKLLSDETPGKNDEEEWEGLEELILPEGLISIGGCAFAGNKKLRVILPGSVQTIGNKAFFAAGIYTDASSAAKPEGWRPRSKAEPLNGWNSDQSVMYNCTFATENGVPYVYSRTVAQQGNSGSGSFGAPPLRKGYTFRGWSFEPGGEIVYAAKYGQFGWNLFSKTDLADCYDADLPVGTVLYAVWEADAG